MITARKQVCGVYAIINVDTGAVYVGASQDIVSRLLQHRADLRRGANSCALLQKAWFDFGEDSFAFEILHELPVNDDKLRKWERYYIRLYNFKVEGVYNSYTGKCNGTHVVTEESRQKMRMAKIGTHQTDKHKRNIQKASLAYWNRPESAEHRCKLQQLQDSKK